MPLLTQSQAVLEIGSGTGQHAVYFARNMPHLQWYTSDLPEYHAGIGAWIDDSGLNNVHLPLTLDVDQAAWPEVRADTVFSANTLHIMSWAHVQKFFDGVGEYLPAEGQCIVYGPFNYNNQYTSESNRSFDQWLKARDPDSGVRNFEDINRLAEKAGMQLESDYDMPANNRILHWVKA